MSGVILRTHAVAVVNKGGGVPTKMFDRKITDPFGITVREVKEKREARKRVKGSDYIVFRCPGCTQRNRKSIYESIGQTADGEWLSFRCNRCHREIEVARAAEVKAQPQIVDSHGRPMAENHA